MLPKCPYCKDNFITAKSKHFARQEGMDEDICIYCLAEKTGKRIGRTGLVDFSKHNSKREGSYGEIKTTSYQRSVKKCRPCLDRRKRS